MVGGGFTPFIAAALVDMGNGSWHAVAAYLGIGCLLSVVAAAMVRPREGM